MKPLIVLLLFAPASDLIAQTKLIAHRSHSGSDDTFTLICSDNFGLGPESYYMIEPDTVRAIDTVAKPIEPVRVIPKLISPQLEPSGTQTAPVTLPEMKATPDTLKRNPHDETSPPQPASLPDVSEERKEVSVPAAAHSHAQGEPAHDRHASLLWLALALAMPAAGSIVVGVRRRDRS